MPRHSKTAAIIRLNWARCATAWSSLISEVESRASGKRIATLRLDGHGNLGRWMTVSVGDVVRMSKKEHGCSLGKRPATRKMMAKVADLWEVPISAGVDLQPFEVVTYFHGPVVTVFPGAMNLHSCLSACGPHAFRASSLSRTHSCSAARFVVVPVLLARQRASPPPPLACPVGGNCELPNPSSDVFATG
jgi:hypothetical protein